MDSTFVKILTLSILFNFNQALVGFDCGSSDPIINTYSLIDTGECDFQEENVKIEDATIELLEISEFKMIRVRQCKIEIKRSIFNCGMFSYLSPVENAIQEYLYDISHENCKFIHETGIFKYDNVHTISSLKINSTKSTGLVLAGKVEGKSCTGAMFADNYGTWNNVIVQAIIKITLLEEYAQVSLKNDKIRLSSGTVCRFSDQHCIDLQAGHTFWSLLLSDNCFQNNYNILYKGPVKKISSENNTIVYTINTNDISFTLEATEKISYCNRIIIKSEHPKLFIYDKADNNLMFNNDIRLNKEIHSNIFTYLNSKFVFVERHFTAQLESLYLNILKEKCELERKVIQNSLSIASISPDEFAYNLMEKPGYIARMAGEAVHIIKCTPVNVNIFHTEQCYTQLPVTTSNKTLFLNPKTHILLKFGTQINCNSIIPQYYKINGNWISLMPKPLKTQNIVKSLKAKTDITWKPEKLRSLATSGIYSQGDLDELQDHLMFPLEKASLLNLIARGMQGEEIAQGGLINNLFTPDALEHIAESTWNIIYDKLLKWGSISSVIIMIIIIIQIFKSAFDMIIRGYTLHAVYGWSLHLLGAICGSITHLLVTLKNDNIKEYARKSKNIKTENIELKEVVIGKPTLPHNKQTILMNAEELKEIRTEKTSIPPPIPKSRPCLINLQNKIPLKSERNSKPVSLFNLEPF